MRGWRKQARSRVSVPSMTMASLGLERKCGDEEAGITVASDLVLTSLC